MIEQVELISAELHPAAFNESAKVFWRETTHIWRPSVSTMPRPAFPNVHSWGNRNAAKGRGLSDIRDRAVFAGTWDFPLGTRKALPVSRPTQPHPGRLESTSDTSACAAASQFPPTFPAMSATSAANAQRAELSAGTLGNSGRNILNGSGEATVSFSLFRTIHLNEKARSPSSSTFLTRRISAIPGAPLAPPATALSPPPEMRVSFNLL